MAKKRSPIWLMPKNEFKELVKNNTSIANIIRHFGFAVTGIANKMIQQRCKDEDIDMSHIPVGLNSNKGRKFPTRAIPLEEVMIENSTYCRGTLKKRLLKNGMLENKCEICDQDEVWNGIKLVMVLDHKNGRRDDHRRENLRMLCPNCNSQQKTFAGRNGRKKYNCSKCGKATTRKRKYCDDCLKEFYKSHSLSQRKVKNRPSKEQLIKMVKETSYCAVGREYGVSNTCIKKWIN